MTDQNENKIDVRAHEGFLADSLETAPSTAPLIGSTLSERDPHQHPNNDVATTTASGMPASNPFEDVAKSAPLEADLHNLVARNHGVQLMEIHQVHMGTPTPLLLATRTGLQEQEDQLAHIGMVVRVTHTVETTGMPVVGSSIMAMGPSSTQTVTTHQEASGVVVGVLDNFPSDQPPEEPEEKDLFMINTEFVGDLLRDGGGEALAELVKTYTPMLGSSPDFPDAPEIEVDLEKLDQLDLEKDDSNQEGVGDELTDAKKSELAESPDRDEMGEQGEPLPRQPGLRAWEQEIEIQNVGVFWQDSGQPIQLRAYPYVKPEPPPLSR